MFSNGVLRHGGFVSRQVVPLVRHQFHTYLRPHSFSSRACLWHRILLGCRPTVGEHTCLVRNDTADFANLVMSHAQLICEQALARTAFIVFARRSKVQSWKAHVPKNNMRNSSLSTQAWDTKCTFSAESPSSRSCTLQS